MSAIGDYLRETIGNLRGLECQDEETELWDVARRIDVIIETAIPIQAQADWENRANETHDAATIAGIQIGYDRAIAAILKVAN